MKKPTDYRTWVEVDVKAIEKNARTLRGLLSDEVAMAAVVKSNAYGHGMVESARACIRGGASFLAVDELSEALELRSSGIRLPIVVLGYTLPSLYKVAAQKGVSLTISSLESLRAVAKAKLGKKLRIHLKFDTGLHRQGISESHIQQAIRAVSAKGFPAIIEGAYTHFAVMEDPGQAPYSKMQAEAFKGIVAKLNAKGFAPITHISATSGILYSKDFHFDMSRAGIGLYGLWPSPEIERWAKGIVLVPALSWKAIVTEVKLVERGEKVGYDLTYQAPRDSRLAVIPVGYWHGLPRSMSGSTGKPGGHVLVGGARAAIVGRISMDMAVIDVTDIPSVKAGDVAVIIGSQGKERISAEEAAAKAGTINYELVTRINPLLPRIYG